MSVDVSVEIYGVKEALKELRDLDPELRKEINKNARAIVKPYLETVRSKYPQQYLSGMSRNWVQNGRQKFPYDKSKADRGITLKIDTSKKNQSAITIIQKDPAASIIDMAGKAGGSTAQGGRFISAMTMFFGPPSRIVWPTYESASDGIERNMIELVEQVMEAVGRRVVM